MRDEHEQPAEAKPRAQEKVWKWVAIGMIVLYLISLLVEWVHLDLWAVLLITLIIFLILWLVLRERPPVNFMDCLNDCADLEKKGTGAFVPLNISQAFVVPDGPYWLAYFLNSSDEGTPVCYHYDPKTRTAIGREVTDFMTIFRRVQENELLRDLAMERKAKRTQKDAEARAGYDTDEDDKDR